MDELISGNKVYNYELRWLRQGGERSREGKEQVGLSFGVVRCVFKVVASVAFEASDANWQKGAGRQLVFGQT